MFCFLCSEYIIVVKYENIQKHPDEQFRRISGVKRETFEKMLTILRPAKSELTSKGGQKPKESKPRRKYTDEDKDFIVNPDNSIEAIMERFNFETRQEALKVRSYVKSRYS